jgi:hypothetical protein
LNLGHLYFDIVSLAPLDSGTLSNWGNFVLRISYFASLDFFTTVEKALQIAPFMQNEPNFRKSQMNVNKVLTKEYEIWTLGQRGKIEPKTNPIYRGVASGEAGSEAKNAAAFDD